MIMAKKISIYIDDTKLQLLVSSGKEVKKWSQLPLEPGLVKGNVIIKEAEVATRLKLLLKSQKVSAQKAIIGLSGLHCLSRPIILPQLPRGMLDEAVINAAKTALPVELEELYLSWQTIPAPVGKTRVFLVAIPRRTVDALLRVLREVDITPSFLDIKPMALARAVKEPTAIIVDAHSAEFDIVIMAGGVPQPIRTVSFPAEDLAWEAKLPMIRDELDRTIKFYNANNPENPLDANVPIYVSGELTDESAIWQSLSEDFGHPALPLPSPLTYPEQFDAGRYMVNIGLALQELASEKETGLAVTDLDSLPAAYHPRPISVGRIVVLPGVVVVACVLVFLFMLYQDTLAHTDSMRSQLEMTNQVLIQKQLQKKELTDDVARLEETVTAVEASEVTFVRAVDSLDLRRRTVNGDLDAVTYGLPATMVNLASINHAGNTVTIKGYAPDEAKILHYAERLSATLRFSEVVVAGIKKIDDEETEFTLILKKKE
jgi:type IV pilus assembly protein PilM